MLINKRQALEIAESLLTKEKGADDYGSAALKESREIIHNMVEAIRMEEEATKPVRVAPPHAPARPEIYDKFHRPIGYPRPQVKYKQPKKKKKKEEKIEKLNEELANKALTILDLENENRNNKHDGSNQET